MGILKAEGLDFLYETATDIGVHEDDGFYLNDMTTGHRIVSARDKISFSADTDTELFLRLKYHEDIHEIS